MDLLVVDTSVWIDYFAARITPSTRVLEERLRSGEVLMLDLVAYELLRGIREPAQLTLIEAVLNRLVWVDAGGATGSAHAAGLYRGLRKRGVTIRSAIDVLIAAFCIRQEVELLFDDRDYDPFVRYCGLRASANAE